MATQDYVGVLPDSTGKKIDTFAVTDPVNGTVQRQAIVTADPSDVNAAAGVKKASEMETLSDSVYGALANIPMIKDMAEALKQMQRLVGRTLSTALSPVTGELRAIVSTVATVTAVTTVSTLSNATQFNGQLISGTLLVDTNRTSWALNVRARIS